MQAVIADTFAAFRSTLALLKASRKAARIRRLLAEAARAFNDLHTYPRGIRGGRWMCPECNHVHESGECSVWTGLQYPACCSRPAGHRLDEGIKVGGLPA